MFTIDRAANWCTHAYCAMLVARAMLVGPLNDRRLRLCVSALRRRDKKYHEGYTQETMKHALE